MTRAAGLIPAVFLDKNNPVLGTLINATPLAKGDLALKKKFAQLLIGSMLSGVLLVGCNNNDDKTPITDNNIQNPGTDNNLRDNIRNNDLRNNNMQNPTDNDLRDNDLRDNDGLIDNNNIDDDNVNDYKNDTNTDTDKDPSKDKNTKREEMIEDDLDANDRDNRDR